MRNNGSKHRRKHLLEDLGQAFKREAPALLLLLPLLTGAVFSGEIVSEVTGIALHSWVLLALAVSIMNLPKTFSKNKPDELYTIRFARAFRDGFVPMYSAIQWLLEILGEFRSKRQ